MPLVVVMASDCYTYKKQALSITSRKGPAALPAPFSNLSCTRFTKDDGDICLRSCYLSTKSFPGFICMRNPDSIRCLEVPLDVI